MKALANLFFNIEQRFLKPKYLEYLIGLKKETKIKLLSNLTKVKNIFYKEKKKIHFEFGL